jgi:hypothetical protein
VAPERRRRSLLGPAPADCCKGLYCAYCTDTCVNKADPPPLVVAYVTDDTAIDVYLAPPVDTGGLNIREPRQRRWGRAGRGAGWPGETADSASHTRPAHPPARPPVPPALPAAIVGYKIIATQQNTLASFEVTDAGTATSIGPAGTSVSPTRAPTHARTCIPSRHLLRSTTWVQCALCRMHSSAHVPQAVGRTPSGPSACPRMPRLNSPNAACLPARLAAAPHPHLQIKVAVAVTGAYSINAYDIEVFTVTCVGASMASTTTTALLL